MKPILVGAAAFGCVTGPSGAGENGNPRLHGLTADGAVLLAESRNPYTFIIEYAQSRGDTVGHVHTTWRDFEGDFGLNLAGTQ